jgi:DNA invertase Pin-like site-specific DNA recombinase
MQPQTFVAYYRVSTTKQGADGLGIEAQRNAVKAFANGNVIAEFTEVESGGKNNRTQIALALAHAKANKATLLIAKMDRLSRNSAFINNLLEAGVDFIAVDQPHATPLTIRILAAVAQEEREQISKRVKAALAVAKDRGVKLGGVQDSLRTKIDQFDVYIAPIIQSIIDSGKWTANAIANELNERAIRSPKGGLWQAVTVQRVRKRIEEKK